MNRHAFDPARTTPTPTADAVQRLVAERGARVVRAMHEVARQGKSPAVEAVHDLRVASRRADAVLRLFEPWLPRRHANQLRRRLWRVRRAAGRVRDLDVLELELASLARGLTGSTVRRWRGRLTRQRGRELKSLRRRVRRSERRSLAAAFDRVGQKIPRRFQRTKANAEYPSLARVLGAERWLAKAPRTLRRRNDEALHRLRIRLRRARYQLEALDELGVTSPQRVTLIEMLRGLQDGLGNLRDASLHWQWFDKGSWSRKCSVSERQRVVRCLAVWRRRFDPSRLDRLKRQLVRLQRFVAHTRIQEHVDG